MRKIYFLILAAMLMVAGAASAQNHYKAPKGTKNVCHLDSMYVYGNDSIDYEKYIYVRDTTKTSVIVTTYAHEWSKAHTRWQPLSLTKQIYDLQGTLITELLSETTGEDFTLDYGFFNDSTVYIYGDKEMTMLSYYSNATPADFYLNDSVHYSYDAQNNLVEEVQYKPDSQDKKVMVPYRKYVYVYDPTSHQKVADTLYRYRSSAWSLERVYSYVYEGGIRIASYKMTTTGGMELDTLERVEYLYSEGKLVRENTFLKESGVWSEDFDEYIVYTYNACGDIESGHDYVDEGSGLEYSNGYIYFYSTTQEQTESISEVAEQVDFRLAPNPAKVGGPVTLTFSTGNVAAVDVYSIDGVLVKSVRNSAQAVSLDGLNAAGVYVVRLTTVSGMTYSRKLIVK